MSFILSDAFDDKTQHLQNIISPRFLCNSRRFSRISEEDDSEKSLKIINKFCPPETTIYFRKLIFKERIDYEILSNCFQLIDLTLERIKNLDNVNFLPLTLKTLFLDHCEIKEINLSELSNLSNLTISFPYLLNINHRVEYPKNLKSLSLDTGEYVEVDKFPRSLEKLRLSFEDGWTQNIDMNLLPNLHTLNLLALDEMRINFKNTEDHPLENLGLSFRMNVYMDCFFPSVRILRVDDFSMGIGNISLKNIEKLVCDDISFSENIHDFFPLLKEIETWRGNLKTRHPMKRVMCNYSSINEDIESENFYLKSIIPSDRDLHKYKIYDNLVKSKTEIVFECHYNGIICYLNFDNGKCKIQNMKPKKFNYYFENGTFIIENAN